MDNMKKSKLRDKSLGFKEDKDLDELFKNSEDKELSGRARVQFMKNGHRLGKFYWDEIRFVYDFKKKPFLEIKTLNGMTLSIYRNVFGIHSFERMEDFCYFHEIPTFFDTIEFYGEFEWIIHKEDLRERG